MQSVIESTADNLMALFQTNQEENARKLIIGELNKLKDSIERLSAEIALASKESDIVESVSSELPKAPYVLRQDLPSTHSLGRESDVKPKVGTKRSHPDPQFSHPSPKIPCISSTPRVLKQELLSRESDAKPKRSHPDPQFGHSSPKIPHMPSTSRVQKKELPSTHSSGKKSDVKPEVGVKRPHPDPKFSHPSPKVLHIMSPMTTTDNNQPKVIDLTIDSEEDKKSMSKPKHSASNVTETSGHVTGNTTTKTFMVSPSDKTAGGYVPKLDKPPTSHTTMKKHTPEPVKSTKSSKEGAQKEHKQPLKRPHASSNVAKPQRRVKPSGKRKTRCTEKVKKHCRVCSKPDCGECKNCQ